MTSAITDHVADDAGRFRVLARLFLGPDPLIAQRAGWPLSNAVERNPELATPYLSVFVDQLTRNDVHNAVKRNVVRLLQFVDIPERLQGKVFSHCLDLIADPREPIAVKAFSITVAERIAQADQALVDELKLVAGPLVKNASPGLRVRLRKMFPELR